MEIVREVSTTPVAGDFRNDGGTPIVVDTNAKIAYAIDASNSVFPIGATTAGLISAINLSAGTTSQNLSKVTFSNSNGVSFGLSGSVVTASVNAGGSPNFSAGTTSNNLGSVVFSNSHGISFGLNGSTITASYNPPSGRSIAFSAGTLSSSLDSVVFSDSNGMSFGLNGSTITGNFSTNWLTNIVVAANAVSRTRSDFALLNSNGLTFGIDLAGNITASHNGLTTAMASNASTNFAGIGETTGTTAGTDLKMTVDTAGVNISFPKWITTAAASDHSHGNPTLALTNLSGTTASASNGFTLSLSAAAPGGGGGAAISAGANSQNTGTVNFANSNGVTFGLSNNGTMTASHNGLTTARASNDAVGLNTALTAGPLAWTVNSSGISLNASSAAGTTTGFTGANISASMTHNTAGLAISASVAAAGGGADKSASWHEINELVTTACLWNNATYSNRPIFVPFKMGEAITNVSSIQMYVSRTGGTSAAASLHVGIYTIANSTSMNLISSTSFNISLTTSAQFSGIRRLQFTGLGAMSLSPGQYVMGFLASQAGTASWGMNAMGIGSAANVGIIHPGTNSTAATASNTHQLPFNGVWNATSSALPSAVAASSISGGAGANSPRIYAVIKAIDG